MMTSKICEYEHENSKRAITRDSRAPPLMPLKTSEILIVSKLKVLFITDELIL